MGKQVRKVIRAAALTNKRKGAYEFVAAQFMQMWMYLYTNLEDAYIEGFHHIHTNLEVMFPYASCARVSPDGNT